MFDAAAGLGDQRCAPAGSRIGVQLGINADKHLVHSPHEPTRELDIMLRGGHRNAAMQPVSPSSSTLPITTRLCLKHLLHKQININKLINAVTRI